MRYKEPNPPPHNSRRYNIRVEVVYSRIIRRELELALVRVIDNGPTPRNCTGYCAALRQGPELDLAHASR